MLVRDTENIIVQHNRDYPAQADGGDSASRTGIMALCGSYVDKQLLSKFITNDWKLVRHPTQDKWNNPKLTSRDQLICWAAGLHNDTTQWLTIREYSKKFFINKDVLPPDVRLFLHLISNKRPSSALKFWGNLFLAAHVYYNTKIKPDTEQNQLICMLLALAKVDARYDKLLRKYIAQHKTLGTNLLQYWGGTPWRDQVEIFHAMMTALAPYTL